MKNRVRKLRVAAGLTQTELAAKSGIPLSTLHRIDSNPRVKVALGQAVMIARALRLKTTDLLPQSS
jgi:DNA-binding XRE family transcriptional regulator